MSSIVSEVVDTGRDEPVKKKQKIESVNECDAGDEEPSCNKISMRKYNQWLSVSDIQALRNGDKLNDRHINFGQAILKAQFPSVEGLSCTLYQSKPRLISEKIHSGLQIVHCRDAHWILASNLSSSNLEVYDSVYNDVDTATIAILKNLFVFKDVKVVKFQKQSGGNDCGVFSLAAAAHLLLKGDISYLLQDTM
jgi:Ulp1 family protease